MALVGVFVDSSAVEKALNGYFERAANASLSVAGEILQEAIDAVLQSEGRVGSGGAWPQLSEAYLRRRPERSGGQMLQDTGLLANTQVRVGPDWVEVLSPAEYAIYHVLGAGVPKRDFLAIDEEKVLNEVGLLLMDEIAQGLS